MAETSWLSQLPGWLITIPPLPLDPAKAVGLRTMSQDYPMNGDLEALGPARFRVPSSYTLSICTPPVTA